MIPYGKYQWFNWHVSFSEYEPSPDTYDRYRKRRNITDLAVQIISQAYNPGQDVASALTRRRALTSTAARCASDSRPRCIRARSTIR